MIWDIAIILTTIFLLTFFYKIVKDFHLQNPSVYSFGLTIIAIGILEFIFIINSSIITQLNSFSGLEYIEKVSSIFGLLLALFGIGLSMIYQVDNIEKNKYEIIRISSRISYEPYNYYFERLDKLKQEIVFLNKNN